MHTVSGRADHSRHIQGTGEDREREEQLKLVNGRVQY
jgi:hypothetical protein